MNLTKPRQRQSPQLKQGLSGQPPEVHTKPLIKKYLFKNQLLAKFLSKAVSSLKKLHNSMNRLL
jgi:hypothetical protein